MKKIVNYLTLSRIVATFILPFLWYLVRPIYLILFVVIILLTDFFDGMLARKFHVQSIFGSMMDTIADKFFGLIIILILATYIPLYFIPFVLEIIISLINLNAAFLGATVKSTFLGKTKMWFLGLIILIGILFVNQAEIMEFIHNDYIITLYENIDVYLNSCVFLTAGMEIIVAVDYFRHISKQLKNKKEKIKYDFKSKDELKKVLFDTDYYLKNKNTPISKIMLK